MKKLHKLAAAVAVAAGIALSPQAGAIGYNTVGMEQETGGRGDTLLFPVFYGYGENYFTISNSSNQFIQGHLRFRGAAWSGELLDFDVILTPGDVFVFRLADVDGDGFWEIDQSFDPDNFAYTGMLQGCNPEGGVGVAKNNCIDQATDLIPLANNAPENGSCGITPAIINHHRNMGYVEFIGEGVFNGMTEALLRSFISTTPPNGPGRLAAAGQREVGNLLGTSLWSWVQPVDGNSDTGPFNPPGTNPPQTRSASDVPNALSGTAFITTVGKSYGIAYNAEALVDFRTNNFPHRADNYNVVSRGVDGINTVQTSVILHNENAAAPAGDFLYVYGYGETGSSGALQNPYESRISFNNTWGPTLADGDDYRAATPSARTAPVEDMSHLTLFPNTNNDDVFDAPTFGLPTSVSEVEEAIRKSTYYAATVNTLTPPNPNSPRQFFTGFYFDNARFDKACEGNKREGNSSCSNTTLQSWYFAFFPTKFFYAEDGLLWQNAASTAACGINRTGRLLGRRGYLEAAVEHALAVPKPFNIQVWDTTEKTPGSTCIQSPCLVESQNLTLTHELSVFNIKDLKNRFGTSGAHQAWDAGRVVLQVPSDANLCRSSPAQSAACISTFPGLMYTFDMASDGSLAHWRALER
jgi:hypothetical protein